MPIHIRPATNGDRDDVVRVIKAVYDEYSFTWDPEGYHADLYDLEAAYVEQGNIFYVAESDGRVLGTAALEFFDAIPRDLGQIVEYEGYRRIAGTDCSLERLYVHPEARRMGLGRALCKRVIDEAKQADRRAMEIWSDKRLVLAHALYKVLGARVAGERICDDPDVSPEWGLYLDLT